VNALWIDAATFAISAGLVAALVPVTSRPERSSSSFFGDVRAGWDYLRAKPLLVRFFALVVSVNLTAVPLAAVVVPKIARDHYGSARVGGVMLAADGVGVILGGLLFGAIGRRLTAYRSMLFALIVFFLSLLTLGLLPPIPVSVLALGLTGIGFGVLVPNNQILYRRFIDVEFRGRLLGLRDAVVGVSAPTMVVIVGLALDIAPIAPIVIVLGLINLAVLIWFVRDPLFRELNRREAPHPPG
jgi:MFS family permease